MLSKEDLLTRIQQGSPDPNWTVVRPKFSYFLGQILVSLIMITLAVGAIFYYMNKTDHAMVLIGMSLHSDADLQIWRTFDFIALGLAALLFLSILVIHILDLLAIGRQLLVITPEAVFLRLRNKEHFVAYANVTSMAPNVQRGGTVKLIVQATTGQTTLDLDKRFGQPKALAMQIVATRHQIATASRD